MFSGKTMRSIVLSIVMPFFVGLASVHAAEKTSPSRVALVAVGEAPAALVKHAAEWAQVNLALHIDVLPAQPFTGKTLDDAAAAAKAAEPAKKAEPAKPAAAAGKKIDLNTATAAELDTLPQIGEARAKAIIEARAKGKFKNWDDFVKRNVVPSNAESAIKDLVKF